jgi:hypothetical protein
MKKVLITGTILLMISLQAIYGQKFEGLATTPPMGWNSWNKFGCEINETIIRDALYKAGRPMVFSICEWGTNKPWVWGKDIGHMCRLTRI